MAAERHAHDATWSPTPAPDSAERAPDRSGAAGVGRAAALKFVGRVSQLDVETVRAIVATWRDMMRGEGAEAWFAAEEALARAVVVSGRRDDQKPLLTHVADAFAHIVWHGTFGRPDGGVPAPEMRVHATEASGQYLATTAMLAVLVRDHLEPSTFELIYRPFAPYIPPADLARE